MKPTKTPPQHMPSSVTPPSQENTSAVTPPSQDIRSPESTWFDTPEGIAALKDAIAEVEAAIERWQEARRVRPETLHLPHDAAKHNK